VMTKERSLLFGLQNIFAVVVQEWLAATPRRAAALMARGWVGDAAFALRDCDAALRREPSNSKAMHRRVLALQELRQLRVRSVRQSQTHRAATVAGEISESSVEPSVEHPQSVTDRPESGGGQVQTKSRARSDGWTRLPSHRLLGARSALGPTALENANGFQPAGKQRFSLIRPV